MSREQLLYDLFIAYYDARKHKRNTINQLRFEINYEHNIFQLADEIINRTYEPSQSICFVINYPVKREIMAADFRDRVVHHLIYNYINPVLEQQFINDSYSCRTGKGTLYGVKRADLFIKECSKNYIEECYILKLDIQGYFMNINKNILWQKLQIMLPSVIAREERPKQSSTIGFWIASPTARNDGVVHESNNDTINYLLKKTIFNDPTKNCIIKGKTADWNNLHKSKSLFYSDANCGLPIGNLTSQLFSNVYLHYLDCFIKNTLNIKYYGRYVDDFIIVHKNKEFLKQIIPKIADFLQKELKLTLHPKKIYLQHYSKGVKFLGAIIKPNRLYIANRTKGKFFKKMSEINNEIAMFVSNDKETVNDNLKNILLQSRASINSYLGIMQHYKTYNINKKAIKLVPSIFQYGYFKSKNKKTNFQLKNKVKKQIFL